MNYEDERFARSTISGAAEPARVQLLLVAIPHMLGHGDRLPTRPTDRVAFEELRQLAVFLPLVFVALAFIKFSYIVAAVAFLFVLPVMALLNNMLKRAIRAQGMKMRERDGGRFAFTTFMCKEFGLRPQDVTMALVLKMCRDLRLWTAN